MAEPQKKRYRKNKRNLDAFIDLYKPTADELSQYIINLPGEVKRELYSDLKVSLSSPCLP
jgi:hypothetical protein